MIAFMTILKKLAAICRRVLTDDPCHIFRRSAVAPVCTTGHPPTGRRKIRTRELGNNGHSVLGMPSSLRGKSRRPFGRAAYLNRPLVIVKACSQLLPVSVPERVQYPKGLVRSVWNSSLSSLIVSIYEKSYFEI
jgi:hypothetical protein